MPPSSHRHAAACALGVFVLLGAMAPGRTLAADVGTVAAASAHWLLTLLDVLALVAVIAIGSYIWQNRRRHRGGEADKDLPRLTHALRHVDLFGESRPMVEYRGDGDAGEVAAAVNHLLGRVDQYKRRLQARDQRLRRLLSTVTDILYQTDSSGRITWITDSVERVLGYRAADVHGKRFDDFLLDAPKARRAFMGKMELTQYPTRVYRADGSVAWLLASVRRLSDADGQFIGTEGVCRDGTELIEAEQALFKERKRAQITLASIGDGVITTAIDGTVDYMNPAAAALTGESRERAEGRSFDQVCDLVDNHMAQSISGIVEACMKTGHDVHLQRDVLLRNRRQRREFAVEVSVSPIRDSRNEVTGTVVVLHDITELREISRQMTHQATHDALTGLANRQVFEQRLHALLDSAARDNVEHALCYLDLDQFKIVNDTCGHTAGDELLRQIATQLFNEVREVDSIARLGGDEFGVLLHDTKLDHAIRTAERMRARVEDFRFIWQDKLFRTGVSIGVVAINGRSGSLADVLSNADAACYVAKDRGRNRIHVYYPGSDEISNRHSEMERMQRLSEAIDRNAFELHGQIIRAVDWQPGDTFSLEFLIRMRDHNGTLIAPTAFLPIAERYQVMPRIDRWVLGHAVELMEQAPPSFDRVEYFSVNLSGQSMTDDYFIDFALDLLQQGRIDSRRLVFEITETTAVTNFSRATRLIKSLRDLGCRFALDDFGSGLSSFSYLKNLPLDFIKIDGAFVRDITSDPVDLETVKAINQVGHTMGLKTIAEYVDNEQALAALRAIGVDYAQGYHIARPMPVDKLRDSPYFQDS